MAEIGIDVPTLAERVAPLWRTTRSPDGVPVETAEVSLYHWLAGRKPQLPEVALGAVLDELGLALAPRS